MKDKILLVTFALVLSQTIMAQGLQESPLLQQKQHQESRPEQNQKGGAFSVSKRDQTGTNAYAAASILEASSDKSIAYYLHVTKQNGWFIGIGPVLTKEEASHLNVVYKFSNKNKAGHWMKLEAIDGYGDYSTNHSIATYIAQPSSNDSTINADWKEKLASVCQWEFMPDGSGNSVIMERAYDDQKKLVYNYQPVFISDKEIIGSYTDSWGLPAKISQRNGKPENVLVNIKLDQWGNDSIIKLVDTEGNLLMNNSGSWIVRNICDKQGNILENYALNQLGAPMNDNYGNCSWIKKVDNYGNTLYGAFYDAGKNPVRISLDYTYDDVLEEHYVYDRWHRMITKSFYNGNEPDTTSQGVHSIEYTYNNHGQILSIIARGLNNEPRGYGKAKSAFDYYKYDKKGNGLSLLRLGSDSIYLNSDYYCRMENDYDGEDLKEKRNYIYDGSDTILWHFESYSPKVERYYHREDRACVDSLDVKGNILSRTYVSMEQDPYSLPNRSPVDHSPYSRYVSTYQYAPHLCTKVTTYYDKNGNWARSNSNYKSPARTIVTTDSLRHTITHTEFDKDSLMLAHYQEVYDEHFCMLQYKQSLTTTGEPGRSGMNDALYYKTKVEYTPTGQVSSVTSLNEFDEPTYAYSDYHYYCYQINDNYGKPIYYDENKNIVERESRPTGTKVACVEIIRDSGKNNGLRDGDILIRYADWFFSHNQEIYDDGFNDLYAQMVFSAVKDSIEIWVLRHSPKEKESKIIKLNVKGGTSSQIGFAVHEIYYTNKETQTYIRTFIAFKNEEEEAGRSVFPTKKQSKKVYYADIIVPQYSNSSKKTILSDSWQNPMLLIAIKKDGQSGWPRSNKDQIYYYGGKFMGISPFRSFRNLSTASSGDVFIISENGTNLKCDSLKNNFYDYVYYSVSFSEEEHMIVLKLLEQAKEKYPNVFISDRNEYLSDILKSQPQQDAINSQKLINTLIENNAGYLVKDTSHWFLKHIEDLDSTNVLRVYSPFSADATKYRELTYQLDKSYYTSQIEPQDTNQIAKKGIVFLHESQAGIDEILYLSEDTVVWAKGSMTHGTKDIIKKNFLGGEYSPLDKYNQEDMTLGDMATKHKIASYWHSLERYDLSYPIFKKLSKQKYGPAYTSLANAYIKGEGCRTDTTRAISIYEKALKYGEPVHKDLGELYYKKHQYKAAVQLLKQDADIDSYELLGSIYENGGNGIKINLDSALFYYKQGVDNSNNISTWGRFYDHLKRVRAQRVYTPDDFKELSSLIACSISADSLYGIGQKYYSKEDYVKAYPYLKAAADSLHPFAEEAMADYMEKTQFGFNNKQKAQEYRQLAIKHYLERAEAGKLWAYRNVAYMYETKDIEGKGIDKEKAKQYYKQYYKLNIQRHPYLMAKELGDIYKEEYKFTEALEAYLIGAKAGEEECMLPTAQLYELDLNIPEAIYWYQECYQKSKDKEERAKAKNALERLGTPIVQRIRETDLVGVWVHKNVGVKVYLPKGDFFALYYKDYSNISKELMDCQFRPWMFGTFYVNGNNQYIEDIEKRDVNSFLGVQHMTCQIDNEVMRACWENKSNERWEKISNSDSLITHITKNWDSYKKYLQENLQYSK